MRGYTAPHSATRKRAHTQSRTPAEHDERLYPLVHARGRAEWQNRSESGTTVVPRWTRGTLSSGDQGIQRDAHSVTTWYVEFHTRPSTLVPRVTLHIVLLVCTYGNMPSERKLRGHMLFPWVACTLYLTRANLVRLQSENVSSVMILLYPSISVYRRFIGYIHRSDKQTQVTQ